MLYNGMQKASSYLTGSSEQKILERSIWATPFPTNALFPWKLVAPRVHRPSKSEKTDTTSPAFIAAGRFQTFYSSNITINVPNFFFFFLKYCFILTFGAGNDPGGKDMSASQYSAATLSADHHLRADLLHTSEKRKRALGILLLNLKFFYKYSPFLSYLGPLTGRSSTSGICEWVRICEEVSSADELHLCCFNNIAIIIIISLADLYATGHQRRQ